MISGGSKPQGLAYHPATDALYIASGGDGTWRSSAAMITQRWRESPWARMRTTSVWMRSRTKYGHGGLAVIDVTSRRKIAEIDLKTHPEGFQLDQANNRIFVNDPTNQAIVVVDRAAGKEMARWPTGDGGNFPMALYPKAEHVVVAFRNPARLAAYSIADGAAVANVELCADADDVFRGRETRARVCQLRGWPFGCFRCAWERVSTHRSSRHATRSANLAFRPRVESAIHCGSCDIVGTGGHLGVSQQRCKQRVAPVGGSRHSSAKAFS